MIYESAGFLEEELLHLAVVFLIIGKVIAEIKFILEGVNGVIKRDLVLLDINEGVSVDCLLEELIVLALGDALEKGEKLRLIWGTPHLMF